MDHRIATRTIAKEWRRSVGLAVSLAATSDGRWALVSTSITAIVASTMALLALSAAPPLHGKTQADVTAFMPYRVFSDLVKQGRDLASTSLFGQGALRAKPGTVLEPVNEFSDPDDDASSGVETQTLTVERGDTIAGILENAGVPNIDANSVVLALAKVFDPRSMRAGQTLVVTFESIAKPADAGAVPPATVIDVDSGSDYDTGDSGAVTEAAPTPAGRLLSVSFSPSVEHNVSVVRGSNGSFVAQDVVKPLVAHFHRAGATIDSSLYLSATQAGIPTDVVVSMIKMFSYKVDFQRDLHPGDSFEVYYSYYYTPDGLPAKTGDITYARMSVAGKQIALYRYQADPDDEPDYFDSQGVSVKGMLMKTPVDGARITSGFGMRFHPILGYTRMHKGIDFGVPIGTPVMAAGAGTIITMGVEHGYGNFVQIRHNEGISTAYGHLSRFAAGLHTGSHVAQGQVFAYSGMSGMATGPHLHYEIRINNIQVNPALVKFASGRKLEGNDLRDFLIARMHADTVLASTPLESKVADGATDLRQAKAQ